MAKHKIAIYEIVQPKDVEHVGMYARKADRDEIFASRGEPDLRVMLRESLALSQFSRVVLVDDTPAAIFGCGRVQAKTGMPWMIGTDDLNLVPRELLNYGRNFARVMLGYWPYLFNYVHAKNTRAVRWLRAIGFTVSRDVMPWGVFGADFHFFHMERESDV